MTDHRAPISPKLVDEFARIGSVHTEAVVRTVARGALPPSVSRVFAAGTKDAVVELLPSLPIEALRGLASQDDFRAWFVEALQLVAAEILRLNPPQIRRGIHPGYDWGHGTKVLSLFVRDLVLHSRHFSRGDVETLQWWLYCPVDGIVITRLRRLGADPGVRLIREISEDTFWSIQDQLSIAAAEAGVPRVWFDDIWSEPRH